MTSWPSHKNIFFFFFIVSSIHSYIIHGSNHCFVFCFVLQMRTTKKVSVWPVGLVGSVRFERPILDEHGKVANWSTGWRPERPFAIDMAGFAINLK